MSSKQKKILQEVTDAVNFAASIAFWTFAGPFIGVGILGLIFLPFLLMGELPEVGIPLLFVYGIIFFVLNSLGNEKREQDNGFMRGRNVLSDPERLKFLEENDPEGFALVKRYLDDSNHDSDSRREVR